MYRLFCEGLKNYFAYNSGEPSNRLHIAEPVKLITDIELYNTMRANNKLLFDEASNLVYEIGQRQDTVHAFKSFSWELRGCGFNAIKSEFPQSRVEEQIKLIKLLLNSPAYWN